MSRWSDQFEANAIHQTLKQLGGWLDVEVKEIDARHEAERRRLKKSLSLITEIVGGLDPELFPEQHLSLLNQYLTQAAIWGNLQAHASNPTAQYLYDANDFVTTIVPHIFQLAALSRQPKNRDLVKAVEDAYDAFCLKLEKRDHDFETRLHEHHSKLGTLEDGASALTASQTAFKQTLETSLATWQSEYTAAQSDRAEMYSIAQIDRGTKFDETLREWRNKSEAEVKNISAKHEEKLLVTFDSFLLDAETRLADMKVKHDAILEIHGLVGTDGVAGGYQKGATDERTDANFWRKFSMSALGVAALWILTKYYLGFDLTPAGEVNWAEVVTGVSLTLVLLGAAGYAARQAKLHRETEQHMRWFALEVKAIDPFLSSLPAEMRDGLKTQLSQKLFGQNRLTADASDGSVDPAAFKSITDVLLSFIKVTGKG